MRYFRKKILLPVYILFLAAAFCPACVRAANRPVQITKCQLSSAKKVSVTATLSDPSAVSGSKCYLFALSFTQSKIPESARPLAAKKKAKKMTFSANLNNTKSTTLLYSRFVVAVKKNNGAYAAVSNYMYLSNPRKAATYKYSFPTASSKKGLQTSADMLEDAVDLNIRHSTLNIVFSDLIAPDAESNETESVPYSYHGKTYWFRRGIVSEYDTQLTALKENNVIVSAILLLGWRKDLKALIYPDGRKLGHSFYAWNTSNAAAREQLQAALAFLCSRYGSSSARHGRIVNWIVGNEVNNYNVYNYAGSKTLSQYAKIYARMFRLTYNTVTSIYSNARVYISLDHLWNTRVSGSFTSREMLDAFASALESGGSIPWNLAYHPYSSPLTEPRFWANTNSQVEQALTSPVINMGNIGILTSYIRQKYGSETRVILSEQGYTSVRHLKVGDTDLKIDAQKEQAAAIAYSYYLTESDDMIDSFIMNRHVDHQAEVDQGLDLGLWTTDTSGGKMEWADTKKQSWGVFKYMDSNLAENVTADSLSVIGISQWSDVIPGFNPLLYSKNSYATAVPQQVESYQKAASISSKWKLYGAASQIERTKSTLQAGHDGSRNLNSLWGFSQTFSKGLDFTQAPHLCTTLRVHGAEAAKTRVTILFISGNNILESSCVISCDEPVRLSVPLGNWYYQNAVQKIRILVSPVSGGWADDAFLKMSYPLRG